jgi:hypothetical protein
LALVETVAGPDGSFAVKVPLKGDSAEASVDVAAPGYQSLAGTFTAGGPSVRVTVKKDAVCLEPLSLVT